MKDEAKMNKNREKKAQLIRELSDKAQKAKIMVFTNYQGMTHIQLEDLKKALKKINAEIVVTKNTLLKLALQKGITSSTGTTGNQKAPDTRDTFDTRGTLKLDGPTATLFAYEDAITPLKEITKSFKALKLPIIKFGIFEGKVLADTDVIRLSTLPPRDMLIAQVVGGFKSPLYGLHRALRWNMQKLVLTLNAIQKTKQA